MEFGVTKSDNRKKTDEISTVYEDYQEAGLLEPWVDLAKQI